MIFNIKFIKLKFNKSAIGYAKPKVAPESVNLNIFLVIKKQCKSLITIAFHSVHILCFITYIIDYDNMIKSIRKAKITDDVIN